MWKSKSLPSAALAALLCLGLPILAGGRLPAALAQVSVSFKEWPVPTKGSHPHDPLAAADGSLWYTGQMASTLGRLDPETGVFKEYRTNVPNSGPHGLVADQDGNIWFTASFAGYIGKLDPNTGAITEYRLPADARDPHTPVFDQAGNLWFTVIGANAIGRLVPKTGEIRIVHVPTKNALPYGIAVSSDGIPYFAEFGTNKLGTVDPTSFKLSENQAVARGLVCRLNQQLFTIKRNGVISLTRGAQHIGETLPRNSGRRIEFERLLILRRRLINA